MTAEERATVNGAVYQLVIANTQRRDPGKPNDPEFIVRAVIRRLTAMLDKDAAPRHQAAVLAAYAEKEPTK